MVASSHHQYSDRRAAAINFSGPTTDDHGDAWIPLDFHSQHIFVIGRPLLVRLELFVLHRVCCCNVLAGTRYARVLGSVRR